MKFKSAHMMAQYDELPSLLKTIVEEFCELSVQFGVTPVVTRISDPVPGESGVHPAKRAIDFRDEFSGMRLYTPDQVEEIVMHLNTKYERQDGKVVCLHHSFKGMPHHFHLQVPIDPKVVIIHA
jgi:hypothetical protein